MYTSHRSSPYARSQGPPNLTNPSILKASLAASVVKYLTDPEDEMMKAIQVDVSNVYPSEPLPEVDADDCKYRVRVVVAGPVTDLAAGNYVNKQVGRPRFYIHAFSRSVVASEYVASYIKTQFLETSILRVDGVTYSDYFDVINTHRSSVLVTVLLGCTSAGKPLGCGPGCSEPNPLCPPC